MVTFFTVILAFLALLAVIDLFVGVSNDASNFLNAAVGCRIAPFKVIVAVAGIGILLGATFSGSMMDIAKKGVFNPGMFSFADVMTIYFSVMVTDVILLNAFNSMGLPTSTTVSIVFELLGAATGVAANRILSFGGSLSELGAYINNEKTLTMISAILVSVVVAFVTGVVVQYVTRLIFTFHYEKIFRRLGGLYGGFALTMITYFLVIKGAAGASFMTPELLRAIEENTALILGAVFVLSTVALQAGMILFRLNVFRVIILAGTFALAFAFAGNDLVNFVGVPIAALDSSRIFDASGATNPATFTMGGLAEPIAPATILLLLSGIIMVLTICFSKSAKRVIETSVNLSSSRSGEREQFGASLPGRIIVRLALTTGSIVTKFVPSPVMRAIDRRFEPAIPPAGTEPLPFDYIRASINLIMTAILISSATSLQLPLSTTYVTFMVGMGSSFADRAWDRETAVYRVSGVFAVVTGWFITAFTAFLAASLVATVVLWGGAPAYIILMAAALGVLVKTNFLSGKKEEKAKLRLTDTDRFGVRELLNDAVPKNYRASAELFQGLIEGFLLDDDRSLRRTVNSSSELFDELSEGRALYYQMGLQSASSHGDNDAKFFYYRSFSNMREACRTLKRTAIQTEEHIANRHRVFQGEVAGSLRQLAELIVNFGDEVDRYSRGLGQVAELRDRVRKALELLDYYQEFLLSDISRYGLSLRGCELYMSFLQLAREILTRYDMVLVLQKHLNDACEAKEKAAAAAPSPAAP